MAKKDEETPKPELIVCLICKAQGVEIKRCKGGSERFTAYCATCGCRMFFGETAYRRLDNDLQIYTA
jgi:hypothetical protein